MNKRDMIIKESRGIIRIERKKEKKEKKREKREKRERDGAHRRRAMVFAE